MNGPTRFGWFWLGLALLTAAWTSCQISPALDANEAALVDLMAQRLEVGREVAWSKFNSGAAIIDAPREQAVLAALVGQATRAGVDTQAATAFFNAQILASRQLQTELIASWRQGTPRPSTSPVDLITVIRPRLDAIGEKMVSALVGEQRRAGSSRAPLQAALRARGFSEAVARLATAGW